jgi:hypothetical protein
VEDRFLNAVFKIEQSHCAPHRPKAATELRRVTLRRPSFIAENSRAPSKIYFQGRGIFEGK